MWTVPLYARKPGAAVGFYPTYTYAPKAVLHPFLQISGATPTLTISNGSSTTTIGYVSYGSNGGKIWDHTSALTFAAGGNAYIVSAADQVDGATWTANGTSNYAVVGGAVARSINGQPVWQAQGGFTRAFSGWSGSAKFTAALACLDLSGYSGYIPFFQIAPTASGNATSAPSSGLSVCLNSGDLNAIRGSSSLSPANPLTSGQAMVLVAGGDGSNIIEYVNGTSQGTVADSTSFLASGDIAVVADFAGNGFTCCFGGTTIWDNEASADIAEFHAWHSAMYGSP